MIDFILFTFVVGVFCGGFWCGAKFGTLKGMCRRGIDAAKAWVA
jgi:hypothetical protein